jgi:membrane protease YdiL (CAAX protease family)
MTIQVTSMDLSQREPLAQMNRLQRISLFILFLICEAVIFIFGSHYFDVFSTNKNLTYNLIISAVFLSAALWFKYDQRWNRYWQVVFAFFVASVAYPLTAIFDPWIRAVLDWFSLTVDTSKGLAIEKICEVTLKVIPILVLVKLSSANLASVYMQRGNLTLGIGIGLLVFFFLAPAAFAFGAQRFTSMDTLAAAVVWGLVFSIVNGFMEELWLRGIFLKHFEPLLGIHGSVWLTAIIFGLMHGMAFYFTPAVLPFFVINNLALGLGCGYLMMKSDNIWGATLVHIASDYFLFIAVLANV